MEICPISTLEGVEQFCLVKPGFYEYITEKVTINTFCTISNEIFVSEFIIFISLFP